MGHKRNRATINRKRAAYARSRKRLPSKFRQFSILDLLIMPYFWICDEIFSRIRYQIWRKSGGKIRP